MINSPPTITSYSALSTKLNIPEIMAKNFARWRFIQGESVLGAKPVALLGASHVFCSIVVAEATLQSGLTSFSEFDSDSP